MAIIPLLFIVAYIVNAVAVCMVAKKRGIATPPPPPQTNPPYILSRFCVDIFSRQQPMRLVLHRHNVSCTALPDSHRAI
jgi:hypothetical protein